MLKTNCSLAGGLTAKTYGTAYGLTFHSYGKSPDLRSWDTNGDSLSNISAFPNGATHPTSWRLPTKPGGIASYTEANITSSASAATTPPTVVNRTASVSITATGSGSLTAVARIFTDLEFIRRGLGPYTVDVYNI